MELKKNWLSLVFSENRLKVWRLRESGMEMVEAEGATINCHHRGWHYQIPLSTEGIDLKGNPVDFHPSDNPKLTCLFVKHFISQLHPSLEFEVHGPDLNKQFYLLLPLGDGLDNRDGYRRVYEGAQEFKGKVYDNGNDTAFQVGEYLDVDPDGNLGPMEPPNLSFRPESLAVHRDKWQGLERFGPYSTEEFRDREFQVLLISSRKMSQDGNRFLGELLGGLQDGIRNGYRPWPKGIGHFFKLGRPICRELTLEKDSSMPIQEEIANFLDGSSKSALQIAYLALENSEDAQDRKLYLETKATFLDWGISCQAFTRKTTQLPPFERAKALGNLALASYAKLGGKPWLLRQPPSFGTELLVGIGSSKYSEGVHGFSTFFSKDGEYRLGGSSRHLNEQAWQEALGSFVVQKIEEIAGKDQWKRGSLVTLHFHLDDSIPFSKVEGLAESLLEKFGSTYQLKTNFLSIGYDHPYRIWDLSRGRQLEIPHQLGRGFGHIVSPDTALLQLSEQEDPEIPYPLIIQRHPSSFNTDMVSILEQVFHFANISWRSFRPGSLPATLEYGNEITSLLDQFEKAGLAGKVKDGLFRNPSQTWFL